MAVPLGFYTNMRIEKRQDIVAALASEVDREYSLEKFELHESTMQSANCYMNM
jgi:hypothetical protein